MADIATALNLDPTRIQRAAVLDNGPIWHAIEMEHATDLAAIDTSAITPVKGLAVGLIAPHTSGDADYEVRMFSMWAELKEDPITGSLNAALAHWMQAQGRVQTPHIVAQGTHIGRHGRVHVVPNAKGEIRIGGHTNILIEGRVTI